MGGPPLAAQTDTVRLSELSALLRTQAPDTNKVLTLLALADIPVAHTPVSTVNHRTVHEAYVPQALALARALEWRRGEALALFLGSIAYEQNGWFARARERLDSAVLLSNALDVHERGMVLQRAALFNAVYELDLGRADSLALASVPCFESCAEPRDIAGSLEAHARVLLFKRDWVNAIVAYYHTIDYGEANGASSTLAIAYEKMGMIMDELGDLDKSYGYFARATQLSDSLGDHFRTFMGYSNWGSTLLKHGRPAEALARFQQAKNIAQAHGLAANIIQWMLVFEADAELQLGRLDLAAALLDSLSRQQPYTLDARTELVSGELALAQGRPAEAIRHCRKALPGAVPYYDQARDGKRACTCLMNAYELQGDMRAAFQWNVEAQRWADTISYAREANTVTRMMAEREYGQRLLADSLSHATELALRNAEAHRQRLLRNGALGVSASLALCAVLFLLQRIRISKEKARSESLLLNILPAEVADELKAKGGYAARHIEQATVLFTDLKGFTEASERLTPQELVEELNTCFKAFDHIITARGIEKIKTIGDAYMCAGGLPDPKRSSVADVVHAALDMQAFMMARAAQRAAQGAPVFGMRVGIHTGPVVAGIVGVKKFQYDIWGDTVNTASRMESSGAVGQVNISESTRMALQHELGFAFTPRGKVSAKGKGELEMYFVAAVQRVQSSGTDTSMSTPAPEDAAVNRPPRSSAR